MIISTDGGISAAKVPEAATEPVARPGSYLLSNISGTAIREKAADVATLEPLAAPKSAEAKTVDEARPPGIRARKIRAAPNKLRVRPA